jgi:hypothetical protein
MAPHRRRKYRLSIKEISFFDIYRLTISWFGFIDYRHRPYRRSTMTKTINLTAIVAAIALTVFTFHEATALPVATIAVASPQIA